MRYLSIILCTVVLLSGCAFCQKNPAQCTLGAVGLVVGIAVADEDLVGGAMGWMVGDSVGQIVDETNE